MPATCSLNTLGEMPFCKRIREHLFGSQVLYFYSVILDLLFHNIILNVNVLWQPHLTYCCESKLLLAHCRSKS